MSYLDHDDHVGQREELLKLLPAYLPISVGDRISNLIIGY